MVYQFCVPLNPVPKNPLYCVFTGGPQGQEQTRFEVVHEIGYKKMVLVCGKILQLRGDDQGKVAQRGLLSGAWPAKGSRQVNSNVSAGPSLVYHLGLSQPFPGPQRLHLQRGKSI